MTQNPTTHFRKLSRTIRSCNTQDQLFSAKTMVDNFNKYWVYHKLDNESLNIYLKYLDILVKYKQNILSGYD
jgi:hypothetical protein